MTITRIANAFIMGMTEAVTAEIIFLSELTRPKSRIMRTARIRRTNHDGKLEDDTSSTDMNTMKASRLFHGSRMKRRQKLTYILRRSSTGGNNQRELCQ